MERTSYDEVRDHIARLIAGVRDELALEQREEGLLTRSDANLTLSRLIVVDLVLANLLVFLLIPEFLVYWITASFFLYVINPFLLLIPSAGTGSTDEKDRASPNPLANLRDLELMENKWVLIKVFWNAFFINSQPMGPGFLVIYGLNVLFAVWLDLGLLSWLIIFQSAAILAFYLAIFYFKPYSGQFVESLIDIQNDVYLKIHRKVQPLWRIFLPIGLFGGIAVIVLIAAMLLPGFTLGVIWRSETTTVTGLGFLPTSFILASQIIFVRYSQGAYSRRMLLHMKERKVGILNRYVLAPLETYHRQLEKPTPGVLDRFARDFRDMRSTYLSSKVYRMQVQDLCGFFPVFILVPDLDLILKKETLRLLDEQGDARQVL